MRNGSAAVIIKGLPIWGVLLFLVTGLCLSACPPTIDTANVGFISALIGYVVYLGTIIMLTLSMGSFHALVRLTTPRRPSVGTYLFVVVWYGLAGIIWAGVSSSGVQIAQVLTARDETVLNGTFTSYHQHSGRSRCARTAVFATELGELELCANSGRTLLPQHLHIGNHVRLFGRKSDFTFVLKTVVIVR